MTDNIMLNRANELARLIRQGYVKWRKEYQNICDTFERIYGREWVVDHIEYV